MQTISVDLPADLRHRLDRTARRRRVSRDRPITEACVAIVGDGRTEWPADFFATERLSARDLRFLRSTFGEWLERTLVRRSKKAAPL